jgi:hypothetical protein
MRSAVAPALAVVCLAACGTDGGPEEPAAAECAGAVREDLGLAESQTVRTSDVTVEGDAPERRLTGRWEVADGGNGTFTCVVVGDDGDQPEGLRVTDLQVRRARDPSS